MFKVTPVCGLLKVVRKAGVTKAADRSSSAGRFSSLGFSYLWSHFARIDLRSE